jgi:hypothetical protein
MFLLSVSELRLGNYLTASRRAREAFNLTVDFPKNNVQSDFLAKNIQQGLAKSCCEYWQNGPNIGFASISPPSNKNSNKTSVSRGYSLTAAPAVHYARTTVTIDATVMRLWHHDHLERPRQDVTDDED